MVRTILILCLCCNVVMALGQAGLQKAEKRIRFGIMYSPSVTYRKLNFSNGQRFIADMRNQTETPKYGYTAGIVAQKAFCKKCAVELGVSFSVMGYKTRETELKWEPVNPALPTHVKVSYSHLYIGLTARYRHQLFGDKIKYYVMPGIEVGALIQRKSNMTVIYANGAKSRSTSSVRDGYAETMLTPSFSIGAMHKLSKAFTICIEPIFRYNIISITRGTNNKEHLYTYGLNTILLLTRTRRS